MSKLKTFHFKQIEENKKLQNLIILAFLWNQDEFLTELFFQTSERKVIMYTPINLSEETSQSDCLVICKKINLLVAFI